MGTQKARRIAAGLALLIGSAMTIPAIAATGSGSIKITSLVANQPLADTVDIDWVWKSGTYVKSSSKVNVQVSTNGFTWASLARGVKITAGGYAWDTSVWPDAAYAVRVTVVSTTINSLKSPVFVDNTAPTVRITHPTAGEIIVDGENKASFAVIAGGATLEAEASDNLTGVKTITWYLDDVAIGTGSPFTYSFNDDTPGQHTIKATATDNARNEASSTVSVVAAPGPSAAGAPSGPPEVPVPNPSEAPTAPEVPTLPDPDPSLLPDPSQIPDPTPTAPSVPEPDPSNPPAPPTLPDPTQLLP